MVTALDTTRLLVYRALWLLAIPDGTTQINQLIIWRKLTGIDAFA